MNKTSNAEQAKQTGGMLALYPSPDSVSKLYVPGGEPRDDLHLTIAYFGEDVSELSSVHAQSMLDEEALWLGPVEARAFAHATFNPDAEIGDPCAVYLIGNCPELVPFVSSIHDKAATWYPGSGQHLPWIPHVTAGYGLRAEDLSYTGPIVFDRLVLKWMGESYEHHLPGILG